MISVPILSSDAKWSFRESSSAPDDPDDPNSDSDSGGGGIIVLKDAWKDGVDDGVGGDRVNSTNVILEFDEEGKCRARTR